MKTVWLILSLAFFVPACALLGGFSTMDSGVPTWSAGSSVSSSASCSAGSGLAGSIISMEQKTPKATMNLKSVQLKGDLRADVPEIATISVSTTRVSHTARRLSPADVACIASYVAVLPLWASSSLVPQR
jgi:hypothetical protein